MAPVMVSARELKQAVERKAYAYGISEAVSILLGEYVVDLIKHLYAKPTNQLVPQSLRQSEPSC